MSFFSAVTSTPSKRASRMFSALMVALLMVTLVFSVPKTVEAAATIPTFSIVSVDPGKTVTIQTANFPASQTFTVRMGEFGTLAIGGTVVATVDSGAGGAFQATFTIPAALASSSRVAIRLDSPLGYFAYNWFFNTSGSSATPVPVTGYTGIPTFSIDSVVNGASVTVLTKNFPPNQTFTVRMGLFGTLGVGGTVVGTLDSGAGGAFSATFNIPDALKSEGRIAIRMDSPMGYFAYNWFYNSSTTTTTPVPGTATPVPVTGYTGFPSFGIQSVTSDVDVTILTKNLPPSQTFTVRMGEFGTLGVGGVTVATFDSGAGGAQTITFSIPASLKGRSRIAIRFDSPQGYFAYNWFWNSSTGVSPTPGATAVPGSTPVPVTGYTGFPTFSIASVVKDATVTVTTKNLPPNQAFTVRMGAFGTAAVGGTVVATFDSGAGGAQSITFNIPAGLKGLTQIAVRMDSSAGYFAYNWFWNSNAP